MDFIQKPALQVELPDENFNPDAEPVDGFQFLKKVIYERNNCPAVVVCESPRKNIENADTETTEEMDTAKCSSDQSRLTPTKEWQEMQSKRFSELRNKINEIREFRKTQSVADCNELLDIYDEERWIDFCINNSPLLTHLLEIPDRQIEILLEYIYHKLQEDCESRKVNFHLKDSWMTEWIYGLLAILHTPLEPYVHSLLRDIARICITLRSEMDASISEKDANPVNLLICIISINFNQLDLSDNYY